MLAIMRINETMKIMTKEDNCLVTDPWRFDFSNLRKNAITCQGLNNLQISNNFLINEIMQAKLEKILNTV
jgi:hypothetical protein